MVLAYNCQYLISRKIFVVRKEHYEKDDNPAALYYASLKMKHRR